MEYPKLRQNIQITPFTHQEQRGFILRDSLSEEKTLFVSEGAAFLFPYLNGKFRTDELQGMIEQQTGQSIPNQDIENFIRMLEENLFLDTPAYQQFLQDLHQEYKKSPARPSLMAGNGYPSDKDELLNYLDEIFQDVKLGDGFKLPKEISGAIVPHIDIQRGAKNYTQIYSILKKYPAADTYVVLGVNHHYLTGNPFIFTDRPYQTPLGKLEVDQQLLANLKRQLGWDIFDGELAHRGEHSVEFPALFLSYIYPGLNFSILPILCNFHEKDDDRVKALIHGLEYYLSNSSKKIFLIASVDFSHIGPQFGWQKVVEKTDAKQVEKEDMLTLDYLLKNKPEGFYHDIMKDRNKRNIDALGASYIFLNVLRERKGQLIRYDQAFHPFNTVTFASVLF
jgi:AmmeMemoRadiSam system protein B